MIKILAVLLCCVALPAAAQSVYKCKGAQGAVYQATPCAAGAEQKRWEGQAAPSTPTTQRTATLRPAPSMGAQMITYDGPPSAEACTRAKHVRDQALADTTMRNEREFMATLQGNVRTACK